MAELIRPDVCVIGAGPGAATMAGAVAASGGRVVLADNCGDANERRIGGDLPAHAALIAAAARAEAVRRAGPFGIMAQRPAIDFAKVHEHVRSVTAALAPNQSRERLAGSGVRIVEGAARFTRPDTLAVGDTEIKARRFVVAAATAPAIPQISGLAEVPHLTTRTVAGLTQCPEHLLVIGAGATGLALAQAFRRLGAAVTVLEASRPLAEADPEAAAAVLDQFARDGIAIRAGVEVARVETAGPKLRVLLHRADGEDAVEGSHLLIATGQQPDIGGLGLDAAGIRLNGGRIVVDRGLRTSNRRVYAVGAATGASPLAHVADHHAAVVARRILHRRDARTDEAAVAQVVFTDPELAQAGLTEAQARERHRAIRVLRAPYHDNHRAQAERETRGHLKVITTDRGRILGVTIVGTRAGDMIAAWTLAVSQGLDVRAMTAMCVPEVILADIGAGLAQGGDAGDLTGSWVRRIIAALRRTGS